MKTKVWIEDDLVCVQYSGGEICRNELNNSWLWLLGSIYDESPIEIIDTRRNLQEHQCLLSCVRNGGSK